MISLFDNISFNLDYLAVFFLAIIAVVSVPALIFSLGYLKGHYSPARAAILTAITILFILSMTAVVCSANLLFFLFAWEIMSLLSYFLVVFDYENNQSVRAGIVYLVMTHIGTAFLLAAFLITRNYAGSFDFETVKNSIALLPNTVKNLLFVFLLIGFGTKAGVVPLHIWLPNTYSQAPSHIPSIMSGALSKVALYGLLRILLGIIGVASLWWGITVLLLAAASCFVGVMYALLECDIKKLLAYSSVENMGIILLGIGAGMVFISLKQETLALFAVAAGLFHLLNHAAFKGLLFLCAGSVYRACGTRDIEKMGGLIKRMPWTAGFFLLGVLAIAGMPPLNGFVSEWLILQSLFGGAMALAGAFKIFFIFMMVCLAIISGLAAACFVRAFGIGFLAMPRSQRAQQAHEVSLSMKIAMGISALGIIALGLGATFIWNILLIVSNGVLGIKSDTVVSYIGAIKVSGTLLNMPLVFGIFFLVLALSYIFARLGRGRARVTRGLTWDCGYYALNNRTEYTATAFSKPFRVAFSFFFLPQRRVEKLRESYYHVSSFKYETHTVSLLKQYFYEPVVKSFFLIAGRLKLFQMGSIHWYLGYILIIFMSVIVFVLFR